MAEESFVWEVLMVRFRSGKCRFQLKQRWIASGSDTETDRSWHCKFSCDHFLRDEVHPHRFFYLREESRVSSQLCRVVFPVWQLQRIGEIRFYLSDLRTTHNIFSVHERRRCIGGRCVSETGFVSSSSYNPRLNGSRIVSIVFSEYGPFHPTFLVSDTWGGRRHGPYHRVFKTRLPLCRHSFLSRPGQRLDWNKLFLTPLRVHISMRVFVIPRE